VFAAGTLGPQVPGMLNTNVQAPFQYLLAPPTVRLRRTAALNLEANNHQYIPWDTADEDSELGWTAPVPVGGGGNTTLNGATVANVSSIVVTSATGFTIGDYVKIDTLANAEYRKISNVVGTTISVSTPLRLGHASLVAVVEQTSDPSRYVVMAQGWYFATATISISGTGAAGLVPVVAIAVNGNSNTGVGGSGWEGCVTYVPTGVAAQPKTSVGAWPVYCNVGDYVQVDLWYSNESTITAVDTTAGLECSLRMVWRSV
jgi:hypothetical protein